VRICGTADLQRRLSCAQDVMAVERQKHEEFHRAWERDKNDWERDKTDWEQDRADSRQDRAEWKQDRAEWKQDRAEWKQDRADWALDRRTTDLERADWQARLTAFETERAEWARRRSALEHHSDCLQIQLEVTQRQLRPYQLLDSLGVVTVGYGWARKFKHRVVS